MAELRNNGDGTYSVYDGGTEVAGPMPQAAAVAAVHKLEAEKNAPKKGAIDIREYEARLSAATQEQRHALAGKVSALLVKEVGEDAAARMMADIAPILAQGRDGRRRESVAAKQIAAAASKPKADKT